MAIDPAQYVPTPGEPPPFDASAFAAPGPVFQPSDVNLIPPELLADPQFQVDLGGIQQDIGNRYAGLAQQLGYYDPSTGSRLPGSVELDTQRSLADQARARLAAIQGVTDQEQQRGTIWSGVRGLHQGLAESPILTNMANIESTAGSKLATLYQQLSDLNNQYRTSLGQPILDAANRRIAAINAAAPAAPVAPTGTEAGAPVPASNPGSVYGDPNAPIVYATADTAASTPYYPQGTNIPAAPGAVDQLGGGAMRSATPTSALTPTPPPNPQISAPATPAAAAPLQQAAQTQATHQISVKTPAGLSVTHKVIQPGGPMHRALVNAASRLVAAHAPVPATPKPIVRR